MSHDIAEGLEGLNLGECVVAGHLTKMIPTNMVLICCIVLLLSRFSLRFFPCIAAKINATTDCGTFFIQVDLGISWYMAMSHNPGTPGEHQNSWQMDVHPIKNGINRY